METIKLAIIIPALNEEKTIGAVVKNVIPYGTAIVVNDGSTDGTESIAKENGATVVNHEKNKGYDEAIETGFKKAKELGHQFVLTFDADGQHDASIIKEYIKQFEKGAQLVLGKRPRKARFSEVILGIFFKLKFNVNDILCGMKGYHISLYEQHGRFDRIGSIGTELAFVSLLNNTPFAEVPMTIHQREDLPRFGLFFKANYKILRALFRLMDLERRYA